MPLDQFRWRTDGRYFSKEIHLREIDKLEVTILVDNYTDSLLIEKTDIVKRALIPPPNWLLAENGFSCMPKVFAGSERKGNVNIKAKSKKG